MNIKLIIKVALLIIAAVLAYIFRNLVAGILLGGLAAVAYFTFTGSTLNWKRSKKK